MCMRSATSPLCVIFVFAILILVYYACDYQALSNGASVVGSFWKLPYLIAGRIKDFLECVGGGGRTLTNF